MGAAAISAAGAIIKNILEANNKEVYVRITNTMGKDGTDKEVQVTAHCASGDDKIEEQKLWDGEGFAWKFSKLELEASIKSSRAKNRRPNSLLLQCLDV